MRYSIAKIDLAYGGVMEFTGWTLSREYNEYWEHIFGSDIKKILIVEDDPDSATYIETLLKKMYPDALTLVAVSPEDALEKTATVPYDLAIVDFILSDTVTGLDLCQEIHERRPSAKLVIVSSIKSHQYQDFAEFATVVPDFIEKPVTANKLRNYVVL
jgi:DNA-binding response OmpR family regulator